jgi:3-dehydroquinate synthase
LSTFFRDRPRFDRLVPRDIHHATIDVPFSVPYVHRVRFTDDVLGAETHVLADLLAPADAGPVRVQFWVDANLAAARPDLQQQIGQFCQTCAGRLRCVGDVQVVPGGEAVKNDLGLVQHVLQVFHDANLDRRSYVVAIGGGAMLDAIGFAAAIAHRGLRLVRLPSSTLGQGDSGVGVKNGVNLFRKKNWLGSFAVPWAVVNDTRLLESLRDRDFASGFSECVKVALLKDAGMLDTLCTTAGRIRRREMADALPIIRRSALLHLEHITAGGDPFEMLAARPLDFGHWSAHKLETMSGYALRHGEAVAIGVAADTVYSSLTCGLPRSDAERVLTCLKELGLPLQAPSLGDADTLFDGLEEFRQHLGGELTLTMLRAIGDPVEIHQVDRDRMREAIERVLEFGSSSTP